MLQFMGSQIAGHDLVTENDKMKVTKGLTSFINKIIHQEGIPFMNL